MIQKKICLLGAFAVGKTSLVARFVKSIYSDQYLTTVGVKVDKKTVTADKQEINLIVWDLAGEDEFQKVQMSYLRGASGYLLVADGTRRSTLETARMLQKRVTQSIGMLPFIFIINKNDLVTEWETDDDTIIEFENQGWSVVKASAKTGDGVEAAFRSIAEKMIGSNYSASSPHSGEEAE
ncbi:MAG: GTP-binding protein [Acidobacteria bacterium]|nr:GTP-binding protein [Acidobacteriota bacterium]MCI0666013.1 GTP-binding protein [Acidobacteriota bacterium]